MEDISYKPRRGFLCYLDENDNKIEGYFDILHFDASFIKFKTTNGNVITLPTIRVLKLKEKEDFESGESRTINRR